MNAFQSLLFDIGEWRASLDGLSFTRTAESEAARLELPFSKEVHTTLYELNGDKAPSSDGFTAAFWQCSLDIVKDEIMMLFKDFFETGKFVKSINSTFIVMVPKKGGVEDFKDYRPISLMGNLYKLIAKVLANRLKMVMGRLINKA